METRARRARWIGMALAAGLVLLPLGVVQGDSRSTTGAWSPTGNMNTARFGHTATLLPNGNVLVAGGQSVVGGGVYLATAEQYDPSTGTWSGAGNMSTARYGHTATLLQNGQVLVAGGQYCVNGTCYVAATADLYNPTSGTWSATGSMNTARYDHTATLLQNGDVLVVGGQNCTFACRLLASAELYNPATGTWSPTQRMHWTRQNHTATLLSSGKVLVTGGAGTRGLLDSAELYDPAAGTWSITGKMSGVRSEATATLLSNGHVLVAGGVGAHYKPLATAELYNPTAGTWSSTGSLHTARYGHTATPLSSGKVLIAGGQDIGGPLATAELYSPAAGTWSATGSMNNARASHTATLLQNGQVLVAGGYGATTVLTSTELYQP